MKERKRLINNSLFDLQDVVEKLNQKHEEMADRYQEIASEKIFMLQREDVTKSIQEQMRSMFQHIHAMGGLDPYPRSFEWTDSEIDKLIEKDMEVC